MSELTTNRITELLYAKADTELNNKLSAISEFWRLDETLFQTYTKSERMHGSKVTICNDTWLPHILETVHKSIFDAVRDAHRDRYIKEWLMKVNGALDTVNNLQGGDQ